MESWLCQLCRLTPDCCPSQVDQRKVHVSVNVQVCQLHDWAVLPYKARVDRSGPREEARILAEHFRYHRNVRSSAACPPWVLGQELGWIIASPLRMNFTPLNDIQVTAGNDDERIETSHLFARDQFWRRSEGYIALSRNDWLRTFQYRGKEGRWEAMFLPNGQGTVEWRLGWAIRIPERYFLLVTAAGELEGITVPQGVLTAQQANRTLEQGGFSIAIRPDRDVTVHRGQPIARIVLLSPDSLQTALEETDLQGDE